MYRYQKPLIAWITILFYLLSSSLGAAHFHSLGDDTLHQDCKICVVAKSLHSGDHHLSDISFFLPILPEAYRYQTFKAYTPKLIKGFNSMAPPPFFDFYYRTK